jgi:nucleotide-binding universal stress UspA family protein
MATARTKKSTLLVPMDGSAGALRALALAFDRFSAGGHAGVVALNVQLPMPSSAFVSHDMIHEHQSQVSEEALAPARKLAAKRKLPLTCATAVDDPATAITAFVRKSQGDEIIMGTRGLGRLGGLLLGSTATKVVQLADVPVTLVK